MTLAASLTLLGGGTAPAMGEGVGSSPVIPQRWQRSPTAMLSRMQEPPASCLAALRRREETVAQAFDQGSADLAAKAMAHQVLAHVWLTAIHGETSRSHLELAEAKWSDRLLRGSIGDPAARLYYRLNEPMEPPILSRDSDVRSAPSPVAATEVRKQRDRNRSAIRLVNTWLHEDAAVESDTWELLKSELDRDRLSRRRFWT